jgi:nitroimidazol reductase NimA-like FMN-containing flavoprotein (pyridoxamine 5'-phosphate oxidase superfamily)
MAMAGDRSRRLCMTVEERERFLADVHVGVISVERAAGPPLTVPIWYDYRPGGELWVLTTSESHKGRLLQRAGRFSLCVQDEQPPFYRYVSVEGPVTSIRAADVEEDSRPMAHRYFGESMGDTYVDSADDQALKFTMVPQRWWTVDYSKLA